MTNQSRNLKRYLLQRKEKNVGVTRMISTYLFRFIEKDLAPKSAVTPKGCQGFKGPVPPPFFISNLNIVRTCV
jgi:hypothetical protein